MIRTSITIEPIRMATLLEEIGTADDGAILLFAGTVRRHNEGREVVGMRYDAYREMAERVLRELADEAVRRFGVSHLFASHRTGELDIGDVSVVVAVSSPHRAQAFEAGRYVIDEIKRRLPVWKQEHYTDGSRWLDGAEPPVPEASRE